MAATYEDCEELPQYIIENYASVLASYLNRLRNQETLCDITIIVDGRRFPAHKDVLCAASAYFSAMLTSGFQEASQSEITIEGNSTAFEILLDFAYTGELPELLMTAEIVGDIMTMAIYMQFNKALHLCTEFLDYAYEDKVIQLPDAFNILNIARAHDLSSHQKDAENYLAKHLVEFMETSTFVKETSPEYVESVLKRKDLAQLAKEKQILKAVVAWLKQDWDERRQYAEPFLRLIRLGLVPLADLNQLIDADIQALPECKKMIEEVKKCLDKLALKETNKTILARQYPHLFVSTRWTSADQSEFIAGPWERRNRLRTRVHQNLETGEDFAVCPNGDIVVASNHDRSVYMCSVNSIGEWWYRSNLNLEQGMNPGVEPTPQNVTVNDDGIIYVTCDQYVLMYTAQGVYKDRWVAMSPDNKPSDSEAGQLYGLTIDNNGQVLVGHADYSRYRYISKHRPDGFHIASFKVGVFPAYLAATSYDTIVIGGNTTAQIVDNTGQVLHALTCNKKVSLLTSRGVCCYNDIILVCYSSLINYSDTSELSCFSSVSGEYLGSFIIDKWPHGVTIAKDKLLVLISDDTWHRCKVLEYFHKNSSQ